jgi:hypothetical protein
MIYKSTMDSITSKIRQSLSVLDNQYVAGTVTLLIILYASLAAPKLPPRIAKVFGHNLFKLLFCFLIVYLSIKNVTIAIVLSIALIVSLQTLNRHSFEEQIRSWSPFSSPNQQPMMTQEQQPMPDDTGFESGVSDPNGGCFGTSATIMGSDPDADTYGAAS